MKEHKYIMFVCTGNICRSPLAHALLVNKIREAGLDGEFVVESAGTHAYHVGENADSRMRATSARRGVPFSHPARHFSREDLDRCDYVFAMDHGHFSHIRSMAGGADLNGKLHMFREFDPRGDAGDEVPDPYYGGQSGFDDVFDIVDRTADELIRAFRDGRL